MQCDSFCLSRAPHFAVTFTRVSKICNSACKSRQRLAAAQPITRPREPGQSQGSVGPPGKRSLQPRAPARSVMGPRCILPACFGFPSAECLCAGPLPRRLPLGDGGATVDPPRTDTGAGGVLPRCGDTAPFTASGFPTFPQFISYIRKHDQRF